MINDSWDGLDRLIERTRGALTSATDQQGGPFVGESDEGRVRAEVGPDGRLLTLTIDPKAPRSVTVIGPLVVEAVNAALDARPGGSPDLSALVAHLREVQEQSALEMRRITESLSGALADAIGRVGGDDSGSPSGRDRSR